MSRKRKHGAHGGHDNAERWLLTYADMITLLMAFFILMYTLAKVDAAKFNAVARAIRSSFGYNYVNVIPTVEDEVVKGLPLNPADKGPPPIVAKPKIIPAAYRLSIKNLVKILKREGVLEFVRVSITKKGLVLSIRSEGVLFDSSSSILSPGAKRVLDAVGTVFGAFDNRIEIAGHTDEQKSGATLMTNWNLSSARSLAVTEYLLKNAYLAEDRLMVSAYAQFEGPPMSTPDPEEIRRFQRRVDLIALNDQSSPIRPMEMDLKALSKEPEKNW